MKADDSRARLLRIHTAVVEIEQILRDALEGDHTLSAFTVQEIADKLSRASNEARVEFVSTRPRYTTRPERFGE